MLRKINLLFLLLSLGCNAATITQNPAWWGASHPSLLDGLVSYWKLDESIQTGQGTNTLTDVNSVASTNGILSAAPYFKGDNYLQNTSTNFSLTNAFSVSFWLKRTGGSSGTAFAGFVGKAVSGGDINYLFINASGSTYFYAGTGNIGALIPSNSFIHCVGTYGSDIGTLYTNGVLVGSFTNSTASSKPKAVASFIVGAVLGGSSHYTVGAVDEVSVWSREIAPTEVSQLYNSGAALPLSRFTSSLRTGLVSYWDMDEVSGPRYDSASKRLDSWGTNHLTDVNGVGSTTGKLQLSAFASGGNLLKTVGTSFPYTNISFNLWVNAYRFSDFQQIFNRYSSQINNRSFEFRLDGASVVFVASTNGSTVGNNTLTPVRPAWITTNLWVMYSGTYDGLLLRLYLNGTNWVSQPNPGSLTNSSFAIGIGAGPANNLNFYGKIDEVAFFSRAITSNEISIIYNESKARRFPFNSGP